MKSPLCPRCRVPAIWDRRAVEIETDTGFSWKTVRECRCCRTQVDIKRRYSKKREERKERLKTFFDETLGAGWENR